MNFPGLPAIAQPLTRALLHCYGTIFFGDELCNRSGIPDTITKRLIPLARPAITLAELAGTALPGLQALADAVGRWRWSKLMPAQRSS